MDRRIQLLCAWCGPLFGGLFVLGFWVIAGLVPPPSAASSASTTAAFYRDNAGHLRVGLLVAMMAAPLMVPFLVAIAVQLKRSDRRLAPLAYVQLACGTVFMFEFLLPVLLIGTAAFRPDRPAAETQLLNDTAFTIFLWAVAPGCIEVAAMGIAILMDRSERPLFPRWSGYVDIAVAVVYAGGAGTVFAKTGAFGWGGVFTLWAPLVGFAVWITVTFSTLIKAINREPEPAPT
jgi:hypothetical protein